MKRRLRVTEQKVPTPQNCDVAQRRREGESPSANHTGRSLKRENRQVMFRPPRFEISSADSPVQSCGFINLLVGVLMRAELHGFFGAQADDSQRGEAFV